MIQLLTVFFIYWMLWGGTLLYQSLGAMLVYFVALGGSLSLAAHYALSERKAPPMAYPAALMLIGGVFATLANPDIYNVTFQVLTVWALAGAVMVIAHQLPGDSVRVALVVAGLVMALVILAFPSMHDNSNVTGAWLVLLIPLAGAETFGKRIPYKWTVILYTAGGIAALGMGSRTAFIALVFSLLIYSWGKFERKYWAAIIPFVVFGLFLLVIERPDTFYNRFDYWEQVYDHLGEYKAGGPARLFGVGPGGLYARRAIEEVGKPGEFIPHAHNILVQVIAELGDIGLVTFIGAILWTLANRPKWDRYQWSIVGGVLVYCLFDFPLFFPGFLVVLAVIMGLRGQVENE